MSKPSPSMPTKMIDWSKCCLCQQENDETLICPVDASYSTIAENILQFQEINCLPILIEITKLDNGSGLESSFREHEAKWHKSCSLKFANSKLERAKQRKRKCDDESGTSKRVFTRSSSHETNTVAESICFFCSKPETTEKLHEVCTFQVDYRVRKCAQELQDEVLLSKLSVGDLIALKAKYHAKCIISLYNRAERAVATSESSQSNEQTLKGIALAELVAYIEEIRQDDGTKVFKLADLSKLYKERLDQLGVDVQTRINNTHLKDRILCHLPGMRAYKEGRDVFLAYEHDVGSVLRKGYQTDRDEQSIMMSKIANTIRNEIFSQNVTFSGKFDQSSQDESVPRSLLSLVNMLVNGPNIKDQTHNTSLSQPVLSIAQMVAYNCTKRRHRDNGQIQHLYHCKDREMPLPVYVGLKIHSLTREKKLVDSLYALGVSASYDRVMDIITSMGNSICDYYHQKGVVCPPQLRKGQFTTAAADNIDHNPSSATSTGSFHGTSMTLFQNISTEDSTEEDSVHGFRSVITASKSQRKVKDLPIIYSELAPTTLPVGDVYVPLSNNSLTSTCEKLDEAMENEHNWLKKVEKLRDTEEISSESSISWAAYHASQRPGDHVHPSINAMLPLFSEEASSASMLRHCFEVVQTAVQAVNPGQIPVICVDQPLFAKMKRIQWHMSKEYGEEKFVILLGGLHTEMTCCKLLGHWLEGSGWVEALQEAEIATPGVAESFLKSSHVTRTRHAHQVTACALRLLLDKAYDQYVMALHQIQQGPPESYSFWVRRRKTESAQFLFWHTTLELQLLVFAFVRSLRAGDFQLYVDTLTKLTPWFFSLNHVHYARWMSVHLRDMCSLQSTHPDVAREFQEGKFTVSKSHRNFSRMSIDQGHEQNNRVMKEVGGIIGMTQDTDALLRWAVAGPELFRVLSEFEDTMVEKRGNVTLQRRHHDQSRSTQQLFARQVNALTSTIEVMGNPFEEESKDLLRLHNKDIMDQGSVDFLNVIQIKGQQQYDEFVEDRLRNNSKAVTAPIPRNKVMLFNHQSRKSTNPTKQVDLLKNESSLFARLYVSCQTRDGDLDHFFSHENHPFPPSLSSYGQLRLGKKSDLMDCLEQHVSSTCDVRPDIDATIMDGAVLVNMLRPGKSKTFADYAEQIFVPYIKREQNQSQRIDIVWDQYLDNSLKAQTRDKRAKGSSQRRRVEAQSPIPTNWHQFLRHSSNKQELFKFLNDELLSSMACTLGDKVIVVTDGDTVRSEPKRGITNLAPCNHEEADSRIFVHVNDAVARGHRRILIRTVDTDVVVLAVAVSAKLTEMQLWVLFGSGKDSRFITINEITASLGPQKSLALPVFHAFTGCDTVSQFAHVGKKTAWKVWMTHDEFTSSFLALHDAPQCISETTETSLEKFTILLYDKTMTSASINEVRKLLFTRKGRQMSALPPSKDALNQHIRRAVLQGGHYWANSTHRLRQHPSPSEWGWTCPEEWKPLWSQLPQASASCPELIKCKCRSKCRDCICAQKHLKCTVYCTCRGDCSNN